MVGRAIMRRETDFDELTSAKREAAMQRKQIANPAFDAVLREMRRDRREPVPGPEKQMMRELDQEHEHFLAGQTLFATFE